MPSARFGETPPPPSPACVWPRSSCLCVLYTFYLHWMVFGQVRVRGGDAQDTIVVIFCMPSQDEHQRRLHGFRCHVCFRFLCIPMLCFTSRSGFEQQLPAADSATVSAVSSLTAFIAYASCCCLRQIIPQCDDPLLLRAAPLECSRPAPPTHASVVALCFFC